MDYTISPELASLIEKSVGMSLDEIRRKDFSEIDSSIEERIGRPLKFGHEPGHRGRGNMLIQMGRTISPEEIERRMEKYFGGSDS